MKKIMLLIFLLFVSGCDIEYNIEFNKDNIYNELLFSLNQNEYDNYPISQRKEDIPYDYFNNLEINKYKNNDLIMKKNVKMDDSVTHAKFYDSYNYSDFEQSYLLDKCFQYHVYKNENNSVYLHLSGEFYCFYGDTNINIKSVFKNNDANYDDKQGNEYTWYINEDNYENVNIIFTASNPSLNLFLIISFIILIILSMICYILIRKLKKRDL